MWQFSILNGNAGDAIVAMARTIQMHLRQTVEFSVEIDCEADLNRSQCSNKHTSKSMAVASQESQTSTQDSRASTTESQRVLAELRASNPLLTKEQEQAAMERLLNQGTQSVRLFLTTTSLTALVLLAAPTSAKYSPFPLPDDTYRQTSIKPSRALTGCGGPLLTFGFNDSALQVVLC